jgi:SAM-dependent methyltransferase
MTRDDARLYTDRSWLREVQYRTDANLAARQSIYAYQHPRLDLPAVVLALAGLRGGETVADVGCGNGAYLAELVRRGHAGPVLGLDLSAGMLGSARRRAPGARLVVADAAALPLRDEATDLTLAIHMLYHVPEPSAAVRELRRITRPGGRVLVVLNGEDHLRELRALITTALGDVTNGAPLHPERLRPERLRPERLRLDEGEELLAREFTSVTRHDFGAELVIPGSQPVEDYVRSMGVTQDLADPEALIAAVGRLVSRHDQGTFRIRTHSGCLVCS